MTRIPAAMGTSWSRPAVAGQGPASVHDPAQQNVEVAATPAGLVAAGPNEVVVQQVDLPAGHCN